MFLSVSSSKRATVSMSKMKNVPKYLNKSQLADKWSFLPKQKLTTEVCENL